MSKEFVHSVIGKAILETDFRQALFANPDQALAGFNLTPDEITQIKRIDSEALELMAKALYPSLKDRRS
jgi:hypothetical protein